MGEVCRARDPRLDSQTPVSYVKEDTDLFGQVWRRQLPRRLQIRAGLRF